MNKRKLEDYGVIVSKKKKQENQHQRIIIDECSCKVVYIENFISQEEEKELLKEMKKIQFKKEVIKMFGKEITAPRETFSYGDDDTTYGYARKTEESEKWTDEMKMVRNKVYEKSKEFDDKENPFNFVLINKYKDGNDYIGLHSDNERDMISESCIASLSIGVDGKFNFIKNENKEKISITLKNRSLLLMLGNNQKIFKHELPKTKNIFDKRYNLTFRHLHKK
jgi:alkylated DNA repair dioxygenase AlkB